MSAIRVDWNRTLPALRLTAADIRERLNLTQVESELCILLIEGLTLVGIAKRRKLSIATVKSQIGSIFAKTNTNRQVDLVLILARLALVKQIRTDLA